jgi:hypothetical protein
MSRSISKYIDIKYLNTRDHIKNHKVFIEHISTELMIVNVMTNSLPVKKVYKVMWSI